VNHERPYVIVTIGFEPVRDIVARVCPVGYTPKRVIDWKYAKRDLDPFVLMLKSESFMWCVEADTASERRKVVEDIRACTEDLDYEVILVANENHKFTSRPKRSEGWDHLFWDTASRDTVPYEDKSTLPVVPVPPGTDGLGPDYRRRA